MLFSFPNQHARIDSVGQSGAAPRSAQAPDTWRLSIMTAVALRNDYAFENPSAELSRGEVLTRYRRLRKFQQAASFKGAGFRVS